MSSKSNFASVMERSEELHKLKKISNDIQIYNKLYFDISEIKEAYDICAVALEDDNLCLNSIFNSEYFWS